PRDRRNQSRMMWVLFAWAVCFAGVSQLIKRDLLSAGPLLWLLAALPSVAGVFALIAYGRFLREADELQRIIQLRALALGFGGTLFALAGYRVFERLGAPAAELTDVMLVMMLLYSVASLLGWRRYR
ncbi:MAG: hypothetical protein O7A98_04405, partial [Acidobacteria bacterium]|nr:hypothetical protein [Acidobacteriota bacterium]